MFSRSAPETPSTGDPRQPRRHRSLAVGQSIERLPDDGRKVEILDLGSASGETLAFYSGLSCRLYFADFFEDLQGVARDTEEGIEAFEAACQRVLPLTKETRFDLIHSWDLFNYLSLQEVSSLGAYLRRHSSDTTPLVSLIWTSSRIPAQPHRYAIIDTETVEYRPSCSGQRSGPRYSEPDLVRALGSFRAARSFLLRHGVQEYIFEPKVSSEIAGGDWGG